MKRFTQLFCELDQTTRTNEKVAALEKYFAEAQPADAAWALQFLSGRTLPRVVSNKNLWQWAEAESGLPEWLVGECHDSVGDMAEDHFAAAAEFGRGHFSVLIGTGPANGCCRWRRCRKIQNANCCSKTWRELNPAECLVWNKLITGNFRIGVARTLVVRALAHALKVDPAIMAHRVMGKWQPTAADFLRLASPDGEGGAVARPYPFFLASPLEMKIKRGEPLDELGQVNEWQVEMEMGRDSRATDPARRRDAFMVARR